MSTPQNNLLHQIRLASFQNRKETVFPFIQVSRNALHRTGCPLPSANRRSKIRILLPHQARPFLHHSRYTRSQGSILRSNHQREWEQRREGSEVCYWNRYVVLPESSFEVSDNLTEWENPDALQKVLDSDRFKTFGATVVKPYAAGPAVPQLYETNASPVSAFSLPLTEVFRVEIPGTEEMKRAKQTWELFETALKSNSKNVQVLNGLSTNLEEKLFLGVIGWKASEVRFGGF